MCQIDNIELFAPDDTGVANGNFFGFPFVEEEADLVLMRVPWDATVSYGSGTAAGPQAIIDASTQVEIYDSHYPEAWRRGIATLDSVTYAENNGEAVRAKASRVISNIESGGVELADGEERELLNDVNMACEQLNLAVYQQAKAQLEKGKIVGLVGGDHSTPLGLMKALSDGGQNFGILHIDAHADLRDAYEGFTYSHASIMRNALTLSGVERLVQVGIRDFSHGEIVFAGGDERVSQFSNERLKGESFEGTTWRAQCLDIVGCLPANVYVSFDIDGLSPVYCPSTGTPVPGGLSFDEAMYLLKCLKDSGRKIVGFDLTEVSPSDNDDWDANVGARVLYKLCGATLY